MEELYEFQTELWEILGRRPFDYKILFTGCFCPCVVTAYNKAEVDHRHCTPWDVVFCPMEFNIRRVMRQNFHVDPDTPKDYSPMNDCIVTSLCYQCVVCQHARELKFRRKMDELNWLQEHNSMNQHNQGNGGARARNSTVKEEPANQRMI